MDVKKRKRENGIYTHGNDENDNDDYGNGGVKLTKETNDDDVRDCALAHKNISTGNFCDDNIIERLWFRIVFASK